MTVLFEVKKKAKEKHGNFMLVSPTKKNKINISDYDFRRDIANRLIMSQFTVFEVKVLDEILCNSLSFSVVELANELGCKEEDLQAILEKLSSIHLLKVEHSRVKVNKEMRKYYEAQIDKFDDAFKPGLDFFQGLLKKVPIQVIPSWYVIPRTSDNIFDSIIDRCFFTPTLYQKYLNELSFEDPIMKGIMDDVLLSPELKVRSKTLREKYELTREEFEVYLIHLEFNFVCCLGYNKIGNDWKEVVTPFYEWQYYLKEKQDRLPEVIKETHIDKETEKPQFLFMCLMRSFLLALKSGMQIQVEACSHNNMPVPKITSLKEIAKAHFIEENDIDFLLPYVSRLLAKLQAVRLIDIVDGEVIANQDILDDWAMENLEEIAVKLYRHPRNYLASFQDQKKGNNYRYLREIEQSLMLLPEDKWFYFDYWVNTLEISVGDVKGTFLEKKGKSWRYAFPSYEEAEINFIRATIFEQLFEAGLVIIAKDKNGKDCFQVTHFGKSLFGAGS